MELVQTAGPLTLGWTAIGIDHLTYRICQARADHAVSQILTQMAEKSMTVRQDPWPEAIIDPFSTVSH